MQNVDSKTPLVIRFFGGPAIEAAPGLAPPTLPRKGWGILAMLAAAPAVAQPRDRLAEIFWPDLAEAAARNNLRQVLLGVQRALNDGAGATACVEADRLSIRLGAECRHRLDLIEFAHEPVVCEANDDPARCATCVGLLEAHAALYRGAFLDGYHLDGCPEFEDWLQVQREAMHRRALVLLERLAQCHEKLGDLDRALAHARRHVELEPWNEEGQRRLIRLLALNGQRAAALGQYDSCRRLLKQELGVLPEEASRDLAARIERGEIQARGAAAGDGGAMPPMPSSSWERRQVTVLYCQLETPDADDPDDPDEILGLLRDPQAACARIIRRHSGHVVRTNDGGLLAYFGFPAALEHAARLAVRAGLALAGEGLRGVRLRVGVHTGLIIAGNDPNVPDIIGRASGLAVRLRHLAGADEVVVSAATRRLVEGYFEWAARDGDGAGPDTVGACRAVRETGATGRLDAAASLTPLAGRDAELACLRGCWRDVRAGGFRARLLIGDPGIGKSRLVRAIMDDIGAGSGAVRELQCLPEFSQTPFRPLIGMLEWLYGFAPGDDPEARFRKMAAYLESRHAAMDLETVVPVFAVMLSLPIAPPYRTPDMPLRVQRERIMAVVVDQLRGLAAEKPVLVVVEDLHWCDPTTLELLASVLVAARTAPIFVLATARPEFRPPWPDDAMPQIPVAALDAAAVTALIDSLGLDIAPSAVRRIVAKADGVPLFAEELAHVVDDSGADVPPTLHDLLAARLDAMAGAKGTAQLAAAVGRTFSLALLAELSPMGRDALDDSMRRLAGAGLVIQGPADEFTFRHALFQDAAYRSLTRDDRRAVHRRIAEALQTRFPDIVRHRPEVAARHWGEAGEAETAIELWTRAGRAANVQCAKQEAIARFNSGVALIGAVPDGQRKIQLEFELQVGLGAAHFAADGYGSVEARTAYARAVELGDLHTGRPDTFNALWGLWACTSSRTDYDDSLAMTLRLLRMAQKGADPVPLQQGHFAVGNIRFWRGEFALAREHLEAAMALYRPEHHERLVSDFGENAYVTSGAYLAWTLCLMGLPEQAEATAERALAEARRIAHPFSLGYTLTFVTVLKRMLRRPAETLAVAEETIALAARHGFPLWDAGASLTRGWAMVHLGHLDGFGRMRAAVDSVRSLMSGITLIFLETLADALRESGAFDEALAALAEGREFVARLGDRHVEAELHRLTGACLLGRAAPDPAAAEAEFVRALDVARRQGARLFELRAAVALAGLWREQGRAEAAVELVAGVLGGFTEGFDTPDLMAARKFLEQS